LKRLRITYYRWANGQSTVQFGPPDQRTVLPSSNRVDAQDFVCFVPDDFNPPENEVFVHDTTNHTAELDWINSNVGAFSRGACYDNAQAFVRQFPAYQLRKGFFHSVHWGPQQHWWTRHKTTNQIVDPTASQFPDGVPFPKTSSAYEDLTDLPDDQLLDKVPTGKCAYCAGPAYHHESFCSTECANACVAELNQGINQLPGIMDYSND
jgi:hypothetical protein